MTYKKACESYKESCEVSRIEKESLGSQILIVRAKMERIEQNAKNTQSNLERWSIRAYFFGTSVFFMYHHGMVDMDSLLAVIMCIGVTVLLIRIT